MKEDRERCLAAGMDGYLSKPIQPSELFQRLDHLTPALPVIDDVTPDPIPPAEPTQEKRLDYAEMLNSVGGDEEILLKVLEVFLQQCPAMRAALCNAAADGDGTRLARAAHSLRGGAGIFLTKTTRQFLNDLEACGKSGSFSEVERLISAFDIEMNQIEAELGDVTSAGVLCA